MDEDEKRALLRELSEEKATHFDCRGKLEEMIEECQRKEETENLLNEMIEVSFFFFFSFFSFSLFSFILFFFFSLLFLSPTHLFIR